MKSLSEVKTCSEELMFRVEERLGLTDFSIAALWYEKELERAKLIAEKEATHSVGMSMVTALTDWLLNPVAARWYDPLSHTHIVRALESEGVQHIVFGRLRLLSVLPQFSNRSTTDLLLSLEGSMAYDSNQDLVLDNTASMPVKSVFMAHTLTDDVKKYLMSNHWLVLLYFAITSAQLAGLDNKLLK